MVSQNSISLSFVMRLRQISQGVEFDDPPPHRPLEQPMKMAMDASGHNGRAAIYDGINHVQHVSSANAGNLTVPQLGLTSRSIMRVTI